MGVGGGCLPRSNQGVGSRRGGLNRMDDCHIKREQGNERVGGGVISISKDRGAGNAFSTFAAILHRLLLFTSRSLCVCMLFYTHLLNLEKSLSKVMTLSLRT